MKILQIHNKYKQYGGEDAVLKLEFELLQKNGNQVEQIIFDNKVINSFWSKMSLFYKSIYNFSSAQLLKNKIKMFDPDIIHVHNFFPIASPSIFYIAKKNKIPIILTLHNYRLLCANAELYRNNNPCFNCVNKTFPLDGIIHACYRSSKIESIIITLMASFHKIKNTWHNQVDGFIALTNYSKNLFIQSSTKLNPNKVFIKSNFINEYNSKSINFIRSDYYLFVGRLIDSKGVINLLKAAELFHFNLCIIGDGPLVETVLDFTKKNTNITYEGFQTQEYILKKMAESRALIFPSIKIEGFPVTIIESLSVATPVICFNSGPLGEIIQNNYNGFVYNNTEQLMDIIKTLNQNIEKYNYLYSNAKQSFLNNYTPERNYEELLKIYQTIILNNKIKK